MNRWDVELNTTHDTFHDVGADRLEVNGGSLVFYDEAGRVSVAYGPGHWLAVSLGETDD